jgi:type II secretory pathway pseudopilin PulG
MNRRRQRGLGLVELMVGLVVSLIVLAGAIFVFVGNTESGLFHLRSTRVVQQMRDAMDRMARDIRRAGYLGYRYLAATTVAPGSSAFSNYAALADGSPVAAANTLAVDGSTVTAVALVEPCENVTDPERPELGTYPLCAGIVYAYNLDDDPLSTPVANGPKLGVSGGTGCGSAEYDGNNVELFGLRFSGGAVETRVPVPGTNCAMRWVPLTDPAIATVGDIGTALRDRVGFALFDRCVAVIDRNGNGDVTGDGKVDCEDRDPGDVEVRARVVEIGLVGRSARDPQVVFRLQQAVDLPNATSRILLAGP